jgi:hypothetical protein
MSTAIKDGAGTGNLSKVDQTHRLHTRSVSQDAFLEAVINGKGYVISSGLVTLTDSNESAILYFRSNEDDILLLRRYIITIGPSTDGIDDYAIFRDYSSNVTGTVGIANGSGNPAVIINPNMASSKTLITTNSEIGQQGASITGGLYPVTIYLPTKRTNFIELYVAIPRGSAMAFSIQPPPGNTSMVASVSLNTYKQQ